jgi:hypothetical protein
MAALHQAKTGGRAKGTPNRPKADGAKPQPAAAAGPGPGGGAPPNKLVSPARGRVREAANGLPKLNIRWIKTDSLVENAQNARTHSAGQVTKLANSIREFGFVVPIVTDGKHGVLAGHGRLLAARQLGMDTVPTIGVGHLTARQRKAYVIADNRLALDAGWDKDLLASVVTELKAADYDVTLLGFGEFELGDLLGEDEPEDGPEEKGTVAATKKATCPKCGAKFKV